MKRTSKLLCILLAALMLLSLAACGGGKPADPNLLKVGNYELLYKGACIMKDYDGNDALVLTLDYTNNTDENDCYLLSIVESATQNGTELTLATIFTASATASMRMSCPARLWRSKAPLYLLIRPARSR